MLSGVLSSILNVNSHHLFSVGDRLWWTPKRYFQTAAVHELQDILGSADRNDLDARFAAQGRLREGSQKGIQPRIVAALIWIVMGHKSCLVFGFCLEENQKLSHPAISHDAGWQKGVIIPLSLQAARVSAGG